MSSVAHNGDVQSPAQEPGDLPEELAEALDMAGLQPWPVVPHPPTGKVVPRHVYRGTTEEEFTRLYGLTPTELMAKCFEGMRIEGEELGDRAEMRAFGEKHVVDGSGTGCAILSCSADFSVAVVFAKGRKPVPQDGWVVVFDLQGEQQHVLSVRQELPGLASFHHEREVQYHRKNPPAVRIRALVRIDRDGSKPTVYLNLKDPPIAVPAAEPAKPGGPYFKKSDRYK